MIPTKLWFSGLTLFLVFCRISPLSRSYDCFQPHIACNHFSPEIQPFSTAAVAELVQRRNCLGTAPFCFQPCCVNPLWLAICPILVSEDVEVNPGPECFLCGRCNKPVASNHKELCCDGCDKWWHMKCAGVRIMNTEG